MYVDTTCIGERLRWMKVSLLFVLEFNNMYKNEYEIWIASPSDREYLVAEVYHKLLFAEINQEHGYLEIQIYPTSDRKIMVSLNDFVEALHAAKEHLQAKHVHAAAEDRITIRQKDSNEVCLLSENRMFATISNGLLELNIPQGSLLKLPLDRFVEILSSYIMG